MDDEYHELSTIFPSFTGEDEYELLVDSIKKEGLLSPIVKWQGKIVDGRHRHKACLDANVEPEYEVLSDTLSFEQVRDRIIGLNILRRHMTAGQRSMVAAELANMTHGGDRKSNQIANLQLDNSLKSAANKLSVSKRSVSTAKDVKRDTPDLANKVKNGEMSLNAADTERRKRMGLPEKTNAPKPTVVHLDDLMRESGGDFDGYICAANIMTAARDLFLQEGEEGLEKNLMSALKDSQKFKLSYNVSGLISLYEVLDKNIEELRMLTEPQKKTQYN